MNVTGIYFSGTGNTKHCVKQFVKTLNNVYQSYSLEDDDVQNVIAKSNIIIFGYPVYFSNAPKLVQDFIHQNHTLFQNKKIFIIATMGLFSGDGAGCTARLFKQYGAQVLGGLHLKMPDNIGDEKVLKHTWQKNKAIVQKAEEKIKTAAHYFLKGKYPQNGLRFWHFIAGFFGQRLWFYNKTASYQQKPNINKYKWTGCSKCVSICPMQNLLFVQNKVVHANKCTLCYRCFSSCPTQAITILGKHVYEQYLLDNLNV